MIDRFTNHVLDFMEDKNKTTEATMQDLVRVLSNAPFSLISLTLADDTNSYPL